MMWHTHAAMGAASVWLLTPFLPADPGATAVLTTFAIAGAMVPDLNAVGSKIKHVRVCGIQPLVPVAVAINRELGHRKLLHSLQGWMIWTVLLLPLGGSVGWLFVAALSLGYASHLAGIACTWAGIPLFFPRQKSYHVFPARILVVTGSECEGLFFVAFALLSLIRLLIHLWD